MNSAEQTTPLYFDDAEVWTRFEINHQTTKTGNRYLKADNEERLLFLLKHRGYTPSFGLLNSVRGLQSSLSRNFLNLTTVLEQVVDANSIDKMIWRWRPSRVILEAVWAPPEKIKELRAKYPDLPFVIRIHSREAFLAGEGSALTWMKEYLKIPGVSVAGNNLDFVEGMKKAGWRLEYLPNVYEGFPSHKKLVGKKPRFSPKLDIACFGALRPLKNHLTQATAAKLVARRRRQELRFWVNTTPPQPGKDQILRNLQALLGDELRSIGWLAHEDFLKRILDVEIGLQLSFSESFNIVAADFVLLEKLIFGSNEIGWLPFWLRISDITSPQKIARRILLTTRIFERLPVLRRFSNRWAKRNLRNYNTEALKNWRSFLEKNESAKNCFSSKNSLSST